MDKSITRRILAILLIVSAVGLVCFSTVKGMEISPALTWLLNTATMVVTFYFVEKMKNG